MKKSLLFPVFGVVVFLGYILTMNLLGIDFVSILKTVDLFIFSLVLLVTLGELVFFALAWKKLVNFLHVKLGVLKAFLYVMYSNYLDTVVPVGQAVEEATRMYLVSRDDKEVQGKSIAAVVFHKFIITIVTVIFLLACMPYAFTNDAIELLTFSLIAVQVLTVVMIVLFCWREKLAIRISWKVAKVVTRITSRFGTYDVLQAKIEKVGLTFHNSIIQYIHSKEAVVISVLYTILYFGCTFGVVYLIFLSIGFHALPLVVILSTLLLQAVKAIPIGMPYDVGVSEITMTTLYVWFGLPLAIVAVSTVLTTVVMLCFKLVLGFISYQIVEIKHGVTGKV